MSSTAKPRIAIACGGTGGHLFPGITVGQQFTRRNCDVTLLISEKEIDQQAVQNVWGMDIVPLPGVGLSGKNYLAAFGGFIKSYFAARKLFKRQSVQAVLSMGGYSGAGPIVAGKISGALTFLHESNYIPGRANRWLSRFVTRVFIGFSHSESQFPGCDVLDYGMPVRSQFTPRDAAASRTALGLDPARPTVLVMGGSQGASGINDLLVKSLPHLVKLAPEMQWLHLTGKKDEEKVRRSYAENAKGNFQVRPFLGEMELALASATVVIGRAGASSLAEITAMRVPSILIPFPAATDNHQFHNAHEFERTGAAKVLQQASATPELLGQLILQLAKNQAVRESMLLALKVWNRPRAADAIAENILNTIREKTREVKTSEQSSATS